MRYLKTYKVFESGDSFESADSVKEMIKNFLRDFSDDDIPVDVEAYHPYPPSTTENRALILIGNEDNLKTTLPVYDNIDTFISLNEYLLGEGFEFENVACWIKNNNISESEFVSKKPITIYDFDDLVKKIKNVNEGNVRVNKIKEEGGPKSVGGFEIKDESGNFLGYYNEFPKEFRLLDIYYTKD